MVTPVSYTHLDVYKRQPSHKRTICDEDNARFAKELRAVCEEFGGRMLLGEIFGSHQHQREFLGKENNDGITLSFNCLLYTSRCV